MRFPAPNARRFEFEVMYGVCSTLSAYNGDPQLDIRAMLGDDLGPPQWKLTEMSPDRPQVTCFVPAAATASAARMPSMMVMNC